MRKLGSHLKKFLTLSIGLGIGFLTPLLSEDYKNQEANKTGVSLTDKSELISLISATKSQVLDLANANKTVAKAYDNLMNSVLQAAQEEGSLSGKDVQTICNAVVFAAEQHQQQTRKNSEKTPYICHPIDVAYDLMKIGQVREVSVIVGALLHDAPGERQKQIGQEFGSKIAGLVKEVGSHPVSPQPVHQRNLMIHAPDQSAGSVQIELADLLYSLKELSVSPPSDWNKVKIDQYFEWAQSVVDRFPEVNGPLTAAVNETIKAYWDHQ